MNRILIIGLGSTGREVCDNLLQRIEWANGSIDTIPWLDCVAFETKDSDTAPTKRLEKLVSLAVSGDNLRKMVNNPREYEDDLNLPKWLNRDVIPPTLDPHKGAGACRMAGRLLFLNSATFLNVRTHLENRLRALKKVTIDDIRRAHPSLSPQVTLSDKIRIVVVGTLCGGTASGSFLDFAYLLRDIEDDLSMDLDTFGIFTLPPLEVTDPGIRANVFAAMQEWNHFLSPTTTNIVRFPGKNGVDTPFRDAPFDRSYLVQSPAAGGEEKLQRQIGDYLFSMVTTLDFDEVDGKIADATQFQKGIDKIGASRGWATLGIRTIEYPADLIIRGAALKVTRDVVNAFLAPASGETSPPQLPRMSLDEAGLKSRLQLPKILDEVASAAMRKLDQVTSLQFAQADALVNSGTDSPGALVGFEKGYISRELQKGADAVARDLQKVIAEYPHFAASNLSLPTVIRRLRELKVEVDQELAVCRTQNSQGLSIFAEKKTEARDKFNRLHGSQLNANPGCLGSLFGGKAKAEEQARTTRLNEEREFLREYLVAVTEENLTTVHRIGLYEKMRSLLDALIYRLAGGENAPGIQGQANTLRNRIADAEHDVSTGLNSTKSDYLPNPDVEAEYKKVLQEAARSSNTSESAVEEQWREQVRLSLGFLPTRLAVYPGEDRYDSSLSEAQLTQYADDIREACAKRANPFFQSIMRRPVVDRITDIPAAVRWLQNDTSMLKMDPVATTQWPVEEKQYFSMFFYDDSALNECAQDHHAGFRRELERLAKDNTDGRLIFVKGEDRHRISYVYEFAGFSLNAVSGCQETGATQFRNAFIDRSGRQDQRPQSRDDVFWTPISKEDYKRYQRCRRLFLVGLASGKIAANGVGNIQFLCPQEPALSIRFESRQWDDNAARLYERKRSRELLETFIEDWYRDPAQTPASIVTAMRDFAEYDLGVTVDLLDGDHPMTKDTFLKAAYAYWSSYSDVREAFLSVAPEIDTARKYWRSIGDRINDTQTARVEGYYCPRGHQLGKDRQEDRIRLYSPCTCGEELLSGQEPI